MENQIPQQKKLPKLTKKREGFVKDFIETGNATEAVVRNFNVKDRNVAKAVGSELLTFPNITEAIEVKRKSLRQALIDEGITEDYLAGKVNVLLKATDEKGNTDFTAVDKGLKHATNIYGVIDSNEKPQTQNTYNFLFNSETQADIKSIEEKIKARLLQKNEPDKTD